MKTAIVIDMDNVSVEAIDVAATLLADHEAHIYALGLYRKKTKTLPPINVEKFEELARHAVHHKSQVTTVANTFQAPESSDVKLAQLIGAHVIGKYERAVIVSNDNSLFMLAIMLKQLMPTWIMLTNGVTSYLQRTSSALHAVPTIKVKSKWSIVDCIVKTK